MIGKTFSMKAKGIEFKVVGESEEGWKLESETHPELDLIGKETLNDAIAQGDAVEKLATDSELTQ